MPRKPPRVVAVRKAPAALATGSGAPVKRRDTLERAIGATLRELRLRANLSLTDLGRAASLTAGTLSKIENGQISPSLTTIQALASALNIPITALFAAFEEKRDCSYVPSGRGVVIERRGTKVGHVYQLLGHALGGRLRIEPYLITLREEAMPYTGFHHAGAEFIYMLTGQVMYRHTDRVYHLRPGDSLLFDSGGLHGPERLVEQPMTYLSIIVYRSEMD